MTEKFTLRDILVYTLIGIVFLFFIYLHFPCKIINLVTDSKEYSDLSILLLIPFAYLLGHLLMSLDDIIFNCLLLRFFPKDNPLKNKFWKLYNFLFFGYRNIGIRYNENIENKIFLQTCDKLISEKNYEKADYYQVMSDLFKGIFLIILLSILFDVIHKILEIWKIIILILVWYRAKMFSSYYVRIVKRNIT